jgi:hypothetical protein
LTVFSVLTCEVQSVGIVKDQGARSG